MEKWTLLAGYGPDIQVRSFTVAAFRFLATTFFVSERAAFADRMRATAYSRQNL